MNTKVDHSLQNAHYFRKRDKTEKMLSKVSGINDTASFVVGYTDYNKIHVDCCFVYCNKLIVSRSLIL